MGRGKGRIPVYVYRYRVTASSVPEIKVGGVLIEKGNSLLQIWEFIEFESGETTRCIGKRGPRVCSECHALHEVVRDYGHVGEHGESAPYTPWGVNSVEPV